MWRSRDLASAAVLLAATGLLIWGGEAVASRLAAFCSLMFRSAFDVTPLAPAVALEAGLATIAGSLWLPMTVALAAGTVGTLATVGPLLTAAPLAPKLERLDPAAGLGRLLSWRGGVEAAFAAAKTLVVGAVAIWTVLDALPSLLAIPFAGTGTAAAGLGHLAALLLGRAALALLCLAGADVIYRRAIYLWDQRMTREELRREVREAEGDQVQKAERRRLHAEGLAVASAGGIAIEQHDDRE